MGESSTGLVIFEKIQKEILSDPEIKKNFMGIVSDAAPHMIGGDQGLYGRLIREYPHLFAITDFSHTYNLIFKKALEGFPKNIIDIIIFISKHSRQMVQQKKKTILL